MNHPNITPTRPGPHVPNHGQFPSASTRPAPHPYQTGSPAGAPPIPVPHGMHRPGPPNAAPWGPPPAMRPPVNGYPPLAPVMPPPPHAPAPLPMPMGSPPWHGDSIGGFGAPPPPAPAEVKPKRRRGRIIAAVIVSVAAAGGVGAWMAFGMNGDEDDITATMRAFKSAVDSGDVAAVTAQMCAEEAASLDGLDLPPGTPPPADGTDADEAPAPVTDIVVKGAVAAGTVADNTAEKVYFRKEGEQWKVCSVAKADFDAAA